MGLGGRKYIPPWDDRGRWYYNWHKCYLPSMRQPLTISEKFQWMVDIRNSIDSDDFGDFKLSKKGNKNDQLKRMIEHLKVLKSEGVKTLDGEEINPNPPKFSKIKDRVYADVMDLLRSQDIDPNLDFYSLREYAPKIEAWLLSQFPEEKFRIVCYR